MQPAYPGRRGGPFLPGIEDKDDNLGIVSPGPGPGGGVSGELSTPRACPKNRDTAFPPDEHPPAWLWDALTGCFAAPSGEGRLPFFGQRYNEK